MSKLNTVLITVSNIKTGETYRSRSYPNDDFNNNGKIELYTTPVFKVFIENNLPAQKKEWKALRFMPYWNDPAKPDSKYRTKGWANSGLSHFPKTVVSYYNPNYGVHNRYSPYGGAIQIKGNFLIHAGPETIDESGWGAAGCVEIIGNFDLFKEDIKLLSGSTETNAHDAILKLVAAKKLFVRVDLAVAPKLKNFLWGEVERP
ncbi:MAG: hypothetical protein V4608_00490 [Bacteroidota bacterium]